MWPAASRDNYSNPLDWPRAGVAEWQTRLPDPDKPWWRNWYTRTP